MKQKANQDIRKFLKDHGVTLWELAVMLEVSEPTVIRWLRIELSPEKKAEIMQTVLQKGGDQ